MGFGRKRNVCNQEKTTQDAKVAALEAKVAELQALAAASLPCAFLRKALVEHPTVRLLRALYSFSASLVTAALRLS